MPVNNIPLNYRELQDINSQRVGATTSTSGGSYFGNSIQLGKMPRVNLAGYNPNARTYTQELADAGYGQSKFDKGIDFAQAANLNEQRAQQQTYMEQILTGLGKMGVLFATTFADNMIGGIVGAGNLISEAAQGNIHSWGDAWYAYINNPVSAYLQQINEASERWMPNYYTEAEMNTPWYKQLWHANMLGDHLLKNTGFFLGAALSSQIGAGAISKVMGLSKYRNAFKGVVDVAGKELNTGTDIYKAYKQGKAILNGEKLTADLAAQAKQLKNRETLIKLAAGIAGSSGESRMEAISGANGYQDDSNQLIDRDYQQAMQWLMPQLQEEHPEWFSLVSDGPESNSYHIELTNPKGIEEYNKRVQALEQRRMDAYKEIAKETKDFVNISFLVNKVVLSLDNVFQFGDALTGGFSHAKPFANIVKFVDKTGRYASKAGRAAAGEIIEGFMSPFFEGTQEMIQEATTKSLNRWEGNKFNTYYGQVINPDGLEAGTTYLETFVKALGDTYSSPDDWENFTLGAITAMFGFPSVSSVTTADGKTKRKVTYHNNIVDAIKSAKDIKQNGTAVAKALNDILENKDTNPFFFNFFAQRNLQEAQNEALANDDEKLYKDIEQKKFDSRALTYIRAGRFQDFLDSIEEAYTVQGQDIDTIRGILDKSTNQSLFQGMTDDEILDYYSKQKKQVVKRANTIKSLYDSMITLYSGVATENEIHNLTFVAASINDRENRIKQLSSELVDYINNKVGDLNDLRERYKKILEDIYGVAPDSEISLIEQLNDVKNLGRYFEGLETGSGTVEYLEKVKNRAKELIAKRKSGTPLTTEERKELAKYQRKLKKGNKFISFDAALQAIDEIAEEIDPVNKVDVNRETSDLIRLLAEREHMLDTFKKWSDNPELITEGMLDEISKSIDALYNKKFEKGYEALKGLENDADRKRYIFSQSQKVPNFLAKLKNKLNEEPNDELKRAIDQYEEDIDEIETWREILAEYVDNDQYGSIVDAVFHDIISAIFDAETPEERETAVSELFEEYKLIPANAGLEGFLDEVIEKHNAAKKAKKYAGKKKGKSNFEKGGEEESEEEDDEEESSEELSDATKKLLKVEDSKLMSHLDKLDKDELLEIAADLENVGYVIDDESKEDEESLRMEIEDGIINHREELEDKLSGGQEAANKKGKKKKEESEEEEEEEEEEDDDETLENEGSNIAISSTNPVVGGKVPDGAITPAGTTEVLPKFREAPTDGNAETHSEVSLEAKDVWAGNRQGAKYNIDEMKDLRKRAKVPNKESWVNFGFMEHWKTQEFIDGGDLNTIREFYAKQGLDVPVRIVKIGRKQQTDEDGNFKGYSFGFSESSQEDVFGRSWKRANAAASNTLFLAVEIPDEVRDKLKNYKEAEFTDAAGNRVKAQIIGVLSATGKETKSALKEVHKDLDKIKEDLDSNYVMSNKFRTKLLWIYPGRITKTDKNHTEVEQRNLSTLFELDKNGKLKESAEGKVQIVAYGSQPYTVGRRLGGREIELNGYREFSTVGGGSYVRYGTVWIKTKEADGRVYHKGVKVRDFDKTYTGEDDNSAYAKRIKNALRNLLSSTTFDIGAQNALRDLCSYLYIPGKSTVFFNQKTGDLRIGKGKNTTNIELSGEKNLDKRVEMAYQALKTVGARFSLGQNNVTLDEIIESNILTTDLVDLHNANGSVIVNQLDENGNIIESEDVEKYDVHTGNQGEQEGRAFGKPINVKLSDKTSLTYRKDDTGTWFEANEDLTVTNEVTDANTITLLEAIADVNAGNYDAYAVKIGKTKIRLAGTKIYVNSVKMQDGSVVYFTKDGTIISDKEMLAIRKQIQGKKGKRKAKKVVEELKNRILGGEEVTAEEIEEMEEEVENEDDETMKPEESKAPEETPEETPQLPTPKPQPPKPKGVILGGKSTTRSNLSPEANRRARVLITLSNTHDAIKSVFVERVKALYPPNTPVSKMIDDFAANTTDAVMDKIKALYKAGDMDAVAKQLESEINKKSCGL